MLLIKGVLRSKDFYKRNGVVIHFWNKYVAIVTIDPSTRRQRITWFRVGKPIGHHIFETAPRNFSSIVVIDSCFSTGRAIFKKNIDK